jgi:hypothetical protein
MIFARADFVNVHFNPSGLNKGLGKILGGVGGLSGSGSPFLPSLRRHAVLSSESIRGRPVMGIMKCITHRANRR